MPWSIKHADKIIPIFMLVVVGGIVGFYNVVIEIRDLISDVRSSHDVFVVRVDGHISRVEERFENMNSYERRILAIEILVGANGPPILNSRDEMRAFTVE